MTLDFNKYMHYLNELDIPIEQKRELLRTVWLLVEACVDQAFGTHPVQLARLASGDSDSNGVESGMMLLPLNLPDTVGPEQKGKTNDND